MNNEEAKEIADTTRAQIGNGALYMLGAKNFTYSKEGTLGFTIGRNPGKVTHIEIGLAADDTYTMRFVKVGRAPKYTITELGQVTGVYCDMLCQVIEEKTGLYTSLKRRGS